MVIKDKNLKMYLNILLNKNIEDITEEDCSTIKTISYENNDDPNQYILDLEELDYFPNLEGINFSNVLIRKKDLEKLKEKNIQKLRIQHCAFDSSDNLSLLNNLKSLEAIDSYHENYDFLKNLNELEYLAITKPYTKGFLSIENIIGMNHLKKLSLEQCNLDHIELLKELKELELINLLGSALSAKTESYLKELPNLKKIYIDKEYDIEKLDPNIEIKYTLFEFPEEIEL